MLQQLRGSVVRYESTSYGSLVNFFQLFFFKERREKSETSLSSPYALFFCHLFFKTVRFEFTRQPGAQSNVVKLSLLWFKINATFKSSLMTTQDRSVETLGLELFHLKLYLQENLD